MPTLVTPTLTGIDELVNVNESVGKPVAVLWTSYCRQDNAITAATLNQRGVPTYRDARMCLRAVRTAVDYADFLQRFAQRQREVRRDLPVNA
jgi:acyl-CoA synthetase (NDP forming)